MLTAAAASILILFFLNDIALLFLVAFAQNNHRVLEGKYSW